MSEPLISVIIPVKNAEGTIRRCLDSVIGQDYPHVEVLVVDDGSTDSTAELLRLYAGKVVIITNTVSLGPSRARNDAARQAKGQYLAFTDSDCIVHQDWLRQLLAGFTGPSVAGVGGVQTMPDDESLFGRRVHALLARISFISEYVRSRPSSVIAVAHNPSCNAMYRSDIFIGEGGFLEGLWPGEDVEFDHRLTRKHYGLRLNPKAVVAHYRPKGMSAFKRMMYRYGLTQGYLVRRYGFFRRIQLVPVLGLVLASVFCAGFWCCWPLAASAAIAAVVLVWIFLSRDLHLVLLLFFAIVYWHAGFFKGVLEQKRL